MFKVLDHDDAHSAQREARREEHQRLYVAISQSQRVMCVQVRLQICCPSWARAQVTGTVPGPGGPGIQLGSVLLGWTQKVNVTTTTVGAESQ